MSKRGKKRFWTALVAAVLVATLMIFSVVAEEGPFVGSDKLSVETGEDEEVVEEVLVEEDEEILEDEMSEAEEVVETEEELPTGEVTEEADADASEPTEGGYEAESEIQTMSVEGEIKPLDYVDESEAVCKIVDENGNVLSDSGEEAYFSTVKDAMDAWETTWSDGASATIVMIEDSEESSVVVAPSGSSITLDLNGKTLKKTGGDTAVRVNGTLTIMDSSGNNSGTITGGSPGDGGGIELYTTGAVVNLMSGTISGNTASSSSRGGAGVNFDKQGTFNMYGGVISGNEATNGSAAGVCIQNNGTFNMYDGTITGNIAAANGGGVYVYNGTFNMYGGTISENVATGGNGGGVYVDSSGTFNMSGGTISGHTVASKGAGIYAAGTVAISGGTISDNECTSPGVGAGLYVDGVETTMAGGEISGNKTAYSGAGVYVDNAGTFTMGSGSIKENQVTTSNHAGGAVCTNGSSAGFIMNGGSLTGNSAGSGGAVQAYNGGYFIMNGGTISGNTATGNGGGVEIHAGNNAASFTLNGGTITENTANTNGGGVYISETNCTFTVSGGAVSGNTGNNVYLISGAYITLGKDLSGASNQIGVTTATEPTATSANPPVEYPVQFTTDESGTDYFSTSNQYFFSDKETNTDGDVIGVRASSEGNYLELYVLTPPVFELTYLTDEDGDGPYTTATTSNYLQILAGASDWELLDEEGKQQVNADLAEASGDPDLDYPTLLAQAQAIADATGFEEAYLMADGEGDLYIEATMDNYAQILAGESDWENLSEEAKAQINADLTAAWQEAGGDGELTYPMLLEQARTMKEAAGFEEAYLMADGEGDLYIEATIDNYAQILAGESDWENLSEEAKAQINADLTAAWQEAGGDGELTYPMLLAQARAIADDLGFEEAYLTGDDGALYTEANAENYMQILAGASAWDDLTEEEQAQINADLTAANNSEELTYPMLLAQAKAQSFEQAYLTGDDGELYTVATYSNYEQILAGEDDWNAMSDAEKEAVNQALTDANGGIPLTYEDLLAQAKAYEVAADFVDEYVRGSDGYTYKEATPANYLQILAGEDEWNAMSQAERDAVNAILAANGSPTYEELLAQAKALAAAMDEDLSGGDSVKTGDSNTLYLYLLLAMAAAAAVAGVAVSRKRPV